MKIAAVAKFYVVGFLSLGQHIAPTTGIVRNVSRTDNDDANLASVVALDDGEDAPTDEPGTTEAVATSNTATDDDDRPAPVRPRRQHPGMGIAAEVGIISAAINVASATVGDSALAALLARREEINNAIPPLIAPDQIDGDNENDADADDEEYVNDEAPEPAAERPAAPAPAPAAMTKKAKDARWKVLKTQIDNGVTTEEQLGRVDFQDNHNGTKGLKKMESGKWRAKIYYEKVQRSELYKYEWEASRLYRSAAYHHTHGELPPIPAAIVPAREDGATGVAPASGFTTPSASPPPVDSTNDNVASQDPMAIDASNMGNSNVHSRFSRNENNTRNTRSRRESFYSRRDNEDGNNEDTNDNSSGTPNGRGTANVSDVSLTTQTAVSPGGTVTTTTTARRTIPRPYADESGTDEDVHQGTRSGRSAPLIRDSDNESGLYDTEEENTEDSVGGEDNNESVHGEIINEGRPRMVLSGADAIDNSVIPDDTLELLGGYEYVSSSDDDDDPDIETSGLERNTASIVEPDSPNLNAPNTDVEEAATVSQETDVAPGGGAEETKIEPLDEGIDNGSVGDLTLSGGSEDASSRMTPLGARGIMRLQYSLDNASLSSEEEDDDDEETLSSEEEDDDDEETLSSEEEDDDDEETLSSAEEEDDDHDDARTIPDEVPALEHGPFTLIIEYLAFERARRIEAEEHERIHQQGTWNELESLIFENQQLRRGQRDDRDTIANLIISRSDVRTTLSLVQWNLAQRETEIEEYREGFNALQAAAAHAYEANEEANEAHEQAQQTAANDHQAQEEANEAQEQALQTAVYAHQADELANQADEIAQQTAAHARQAHEQANQADGDAPQNAAHAQQAREYANRADENAQQTAAHAVQAREYANEAQQTAAHARRAHEQANEANENAHQANVDAQQTAAHVQQNAAHANHALGAGVVLSMELFHRREVAQEQENNN